MSADDHSHHHHGHHGHDDDEASDLSETELRVRAIQTILVEKGYTDAAALDAIVETYETKIGPHIGARIVARAWTDPTFHAALLADGTQAAAAFGVDGKIGNHLVVVENTPQRHNMVVCTLCSCYPWDILGLPPTWYKSFAYRSRAVKEPRAVLGEFGVSLRPDTEIRILDSTAEVRYLVLPMRPAGTEQWSEEQLAGIVTRNSMIGTDVLRVPTGAAA
jgi:nitrile hydratase